VPFLNFKSAAALGPIALALAFCLDGCSSQPVPRRQSGIIVGSQGAGSELVFPGVQVAAAMIEPGAEYARRDASLNLRDPASAFDYDAWPAAPQPSLDQARWLSLPTNSATYLYFNQGQWRTYHNACPMWP